MVGNFNPLEARGDIGALRENFVVVERLKALQSNKRLVRFYYWRNNDQQEIDIIEEENARISAFECEYNPKKSAKLPKSFVEDYPDTTFQVINLDSFYDLMVVGDV